MNIATTLINSEGDLTAFAKPGGKEFQNPAAATKYPAGMPLREEETKAARNRKPKGRDGSYMCWDYSTNA